MHFSELPKCLATVNTMNSKNTKIILNNMRSDECTWYVIVDCCIQIVFCLGQGIQSGGSTHAINLLTLVCLQPMQCGLSEMDWAKCKQSNSHKSLTTLCSYFLLSSDNQVMIKSAHWCSCSCDLHGCIW